MEKEEALKNLKKVFGCLTIDLRKCLDGECSSCEYDHEYDRETLADTLKTIEDALKSAPAGDEGK